MQSLRKSFSASSVPTSSLVVQCAHSEDNLHEFFSRVQFATLFSYNNAVDEYVILKKHWKDSKRIDPAEYNRLNTIHSEFVRTYFTQGTIQRLLLGIVDQPYNLFDIPMTELSMDELMFHTDYKLLKSPIMRGVDDGFEFLVLRLRLEGERDHRIDIIAKTHLGLIIHSIDGMPTISKVFESVTSKVLVHLSEKVPEETYFLYSKLVEDRILHRSGVDHRVDKPNAIYLE